VQDALPSLLEHVHRGDLSLPLIVEKTSHAVARLFNIRDRGYIREGYWADLVLVDLDRPHVVENKNVICPLRLVAFRGVPFRSTVEMTMVNGRIVYQNGQVVDPPQRFTPGISSAKHRIDFVMDPPSHSKGIKLMKIKPTFLIVMISLALVQAGHAEDVMQSFSGILWGTPIEEIRGLQESARDGDIHYYKRAEDFYNIAGVTLSDVIYGFYQGKYFAAYMKLTSADIFTRLNATSIPFMAMPVPSCGSTRPFTSGSIWTSKSN
jgi:hypothetical protein